LDSNLGYVPHYDPSNLTLTQKAKKLKSQNNYAVDVILNSVSERIAILFGTTEIASEMWETLLNRFKGNSQMKRTKLMGLESEFEIFYIQEAESIENMYSRLMHIQRNYTSNSKVSITLLFEQDIIYLIFYKRSNYHKNI
jgi:gag-polypeptide of LTR copia-type